MAQSTHRQRDAGTKKDTRRDTCWDTMRDGHPLNGRHTRPPCPALRRRRRAERRPDRPRGQGAGVCRLARLIGVQRRRSPHPHTRPACCAAWEASSRPGSIPPHGPHDRPGRARRRTAHGGPGRPVAGRPAAGAQAGHRKGKTQRAWVTSKGQKIRRRRPRFARI
jgi:hypothetical protein